MKRQLPNQEEIEAQVRAIIQGARAGAQSEDAFVELKQEIPPADRATARKLAAHANAARGEPVLWVVGTDERGAITGAPHTEMSSWWPQVQKHFVESSPRLLDVIVRLEDEPPLQALVFETSLGPFAVKTGKPEPQTDFPWRDGTRTRSATPSEVRSYFHPALPEVALPRATVTAQRIKDRLIWTLHADVYIEADPSTTLVIPEASCWGELHSPELRMRGELQAFRFTQPFHVQDSLVTVLSNQAVFKGPAMANLIGSFESRLPLGTREQPSKELFLELRIRPARYSATLDLKETLNWRKPTDDTWGLWHRDNVRYLSQPSDSVL